MRVFHIISPARLMRLVAGEPSAGVARDHRALAGLNDHYPRDIGFRRERPGRPGRDPWML
jgi:hypothetical protein